MKEGSEKREKLRELILTASKKMFVKKGIKAVRMDDIAASIHISKRTLYEAYDNKRQLLEDVLSRNFDEQRAKMKQLSKECDNVMDILVMFFRLQAENYSSTNPLFYKDLQRYPELFEKSKQLNIDRHREATEFFKRGVEEGYFMPQVNYELFTALGRNAMRDMRINKDYLSYSFFDIFNSVVYVLLRGVCTEKGILRLDAFVADLENNKAEKKQ